MRRAGLLHDIGKLAVSNQILDKPGKPDEAEWESIRSHPGRGEEILARVPAFRRHRAAGRQPPRTAGRAGLSAGIGRAEALCLETRILTVADVFDAQAIAQAGIFVSGAGLMPPDTATTVRLNGHGVQVEDGPFADSKEQLGGFFVIDVPDLDAALEWARKRPPSGSTEIRPVLSRQG